jgi:hypothetical protein
MPGAKLLLQPLYHRRQESIATHFAPERELEQLVRTLPEARWSQTHRCWYFPLTKVHYRSLVDKLTTAGVELDTVLPKRYLEQRKPLLPTPLGGRGAVVNQSQAALLLNKQLCPENLEAYRLFMERLTLKGYSPSTIRTYRTEFLSLLRILGKQNVAELSVERLRRYLLYCTEQEKLSEASVHSRINALKFYFEKVLGWEPLFFELPRPKSRSSYPRCLVRKNCDVCLTLFPIESTKPFSSPLTVQGFAFPKWCTSNSRTWTPIACNFLLKEPKEKRTGW